MKLGYIIIIVLNALSFITTLVTSYESLFKKDKNGERKIFRANDKRGINWPILRLGLLFFTFIGSILFAIRQKQIDDDDKALERENVKKYQDSVFNVAENRANERIRVSDSAIREGLAKWGLKTDSSYVEVKKILDTTKRTINVFNGDEPELSFCEYGIFIKDTIGESIRAIINLCTKKTAAYNIDVNIYIVLHLKSGAYLFISKERPLPIDSYLGSNEGKGFPVIFSKEIIENSQHIFILIKGSLQKPNDNKKIPVEEIGAYSMVKKEMGFATPYFDSKVRKAIDDAGVIVK